MRASETPPRISLYPGPSSLRDAAPTSLRENPLTRDFTPEERSSVAHLLVPRRCAAGEVILVEGAPSHAIFFLLEGELEVRKRDGGEEFPLGSLAVGAIFGEMSFFDGSPASATVVAKTSATIAVLPRSELPEGVEATPMYLRLVGNIAKVAFERLRSSNTSYVDALKAELAQVKLRQSFAQFFIVMMVLFGGATLLPRILSPDLETSSPLLYLASSWGSLLTLLVPTAYFARKQGLPIANFGLTRVGALRSALEGLAFAALLGAPIVVYRLTTLAPGQPLFSWRYEAGYGPLAFQAYVVLYFFHCFLQEFVTRGVVQGSLARFMSESHPAVPILLTSSLFGIFHLYVSVSFAVVVLVGSVIFGLVYQRHRSLLGVTVVHYALSLLTQALGMN